MHRGFLLSLALLVLGLGPGCETEGGRPRQGIHDPIERHSQKSWHWPFGSPRDSHLAPHRATDDPGGSPEDQPRDGTEPVGVSRFENDALPPPFPS